MCNKTCIDFGVANLKPEEIKDKDIIEIGSLDVNGSLRSHVAKYSPRKYIGVDIFEGPGVDVVCDAHDLLNRFPRESFDMVLSTEALEHVYDWRKVISNMKALLKPNGVLLITTRSIGDNYHGYPSDFWRYQIEDAQVIFGDLKIEKLEKDTFVPGIFVKAAKPANFQEKDLSQHKLYSILKFKRVLNVSQPDIFIFSTLWQIYLSLQKLAPKQIKEIIKKVIRRK